MSPRTGMGGFTYLALLFAVVVLGITLATVGIVWSTEIRREKEEQLLFAGDQIRAAIGRYVQGGSGAHSYPMALSDLLDDKRFPTTYRELRRLYRDPMSDSGEWLLIKGPDGGILGVASTSQARPIKVAHFSEQDAAFAGQECYCGWQFVYDPRLLLQRRAQPASVAR